MAEKYKPAYDKSYALIVGVDHYAHLKPLEASVRGAREVARVLRETFSFDVRELCDADATPDAIFRWFQTLKTGRDDRVLFYFAGHGLTRDIGHRDKGYLALAATEKGFWGSALSMDEVLDEAGALAAKHTLYILDACFSGLALQTKDADFDPNRTVKSLLTRAADIAITAGGKEVVDDHAGPGETYSVFTHFLLQGLKGEAALEGILRARSLGLYLETQVSGYRRTGHKPSFGYLPGSEDGDFVFRAEAVELPAGLQNAIENPLAGLRYGAILELEALLTSRNPELARLAREALERLAGDDSRRVSEAANAALGHAPPPVVEVVEPPPPPVIEAIQEVAQPTPPRREKHPLEPVLVEVPAGPFLMGSDKKKDTRAYDDELPQHTVTLPAYAIGKYPVTNAEFMRFVEAARYDWKPKIDVSRKQDHPVVHVTWRDAMAYCEWLSKELGCAVRLPTEAEWEKAARGTDGRIYPWGDMFDTNRCNTRESGVRDTTPVGKYSPGGDSPYGCVDMAGNVWEWCQSLFKGYPYDPGDGREDVTDRNTGRVVRGGAWDYGVDFARCACRSGDGPDPRDVNIGFRVVVSRPHL